MKNFFGIIVCLFLFLFLWFIGGFVTHYIVFNEAYERDFLKEIITFMRIVISQYLIPALSAFCALMYTRKIFKNSINIQVVFISFVTLWTIFVFGGIVMFIKNDQYIEILKLLFQFFVINISIWVSKKIIDDENENK